MCWLCSQVSGNIPFFFIKLQQFFFMSKHFLSSKLRISLVLRNYWLLQQSDSFSAEINCIKWIKFNAAKWQKFVKWHCFCIYYHFLYWLYVLIMSRACFVFPHSIVTLNIKELLAWNRRDIWSLRDCNGTRTHNHLVCKGTLNYLAKLATWLSCVASTDLYGAFNCMFLSCHVRVSEWIHTL